MKNLIAQKIISPLRMGGITRQSFGELSALRAPEWKSALSWLRRSGLALYWWSRIKAEGASGIVPDSIGPLLDEDSHQNHGRVKAMAQEFQSLVNLFEGAGTPYAVLKGFSLTPEYCSDPTLRTQYDFDFLVSEDALGRVDSMLRSSGFVKKAQRQSTGPFEYFHAERRPVLPSNLDKVFSAGLHRGLEIHTRLWEPNVEKIRFVLPEDCLSRRVRKTWNATTFETLAHEDALTFQIIHIFRHILNNQCRVSHLFELANYLQRQPENALVWETFERLLRGGHRLEQASGVVISLSAALFEVDLPRRVRALTTDRLNPALSFWVQRYGLASAVQNFAASKSSLYLHQVFVEKDSDWRAIRRRRLFPIQKPATVARASDRAVTSRLAAHSAQLAYSFRRGWFHTMAALRYAWGLREWRSACQSSGSPSGD